MSDKQMYFDHGPESFLAEVNQIVKVYKLHINTNFTAEHNERVKIEFGAEDPNGNGLIEVTKYGRSYGEALRKIREHIREVMGR